MEELTLSMICTCLVDIIKSLIYRTQVFNSRLFVQPST